MPHAPRRRAAPLGLAALILLAFLASAPSAQAWVCRPDPMGMCQFVQDTTGVVVDAAPSPEGIGVIVVYSVNGNEGEIVVTLCIRDTTVWLSEDGHCTPPPTKNRIEYILP
jgi:hypothetical protein